jgi:opacity protein-like surface antigen
MRTMLLRISFLSVVAAATALAQNSDLGLMIGVAHVVNGFSSTTSTSGTVSVGGQINYAIQLHENPHFYFELPLHITGNTTGQVTDQGAIGSVTTIFYLTPGIRWNFRPAARVSIYAAGGAGAVIVARSQGVASRGSDSGSSGASATAAFDYGLGLDFRLTRLVSLRTEVREAVSAGAIDGRHRNDFFTAGVGLHF